jgi:hypothetical protein
MMVLMFLKKNIAIKCLSWLAMGKYEIDIPYYLPLSENVLVFVISCQFVMIKLLEAQTHLYML